MNLIHNYGIWVATILAALAFMAAGSAKLMGVEAMHQSFALMGLPSWFGYFIGAAELAGGIALFIRPLAALASLGLAIIMVGAAYFHVSYSVPSPVPSLILLALVLFIFFKKRSDLLKFG